MIMISFLVSAQQDLCYDSHSYDFYPGGQVAFEAYLAQDMVYSYCKTANYRTRVYVSFVIQKDGRITDAKVERGICDQIDDKVLARIESMENCNPVYRKTRVRIPVRVEFRE
jgi:hypothetical protein